MVTKTAGRDSKELITRAAARQLLIFQGTCYWAFAREAIWIIVVFVMRDKKTKGGIFLSFMTIFVFMIIGKIENEKKSQKSSIRKDSYIDKKGST